MMATPIPYDATADAARAAWASVQVTMWAAAASTFVGCMAVVVAFYPPILARRQKIKSALYHLGHAVSIGVVVSLRLKKDPDENIFIPEIASKIGASKTALEQFFQLAIDDAEAIRVASNFQTNLLLFSGVLEYVVLKGVSHRPASAFKGQLDQFDKPLSTTLIDLQKLMRRYGIKSAKAEISQPAQP